MGRSASLFVFRHGVWVCSSGVGVWVGWYRGAGRGCWAGLGWLWCGYMVLSVGKVGVAHAEYYVSAEAVGAVSYYADGGAAAGVWVSGGGWSVGSGSLVSADALRAALSGVDPGTGERLGQPYVVGGTFRDVLGVERPRRPVGAFDLTYSPTKGFSAGWAVADAATRVEIGAAYDVSVGAVVDYLQTHAVGSRVGKGGKERVGVPGGAAVARFDHWTSRAGDPQLHSHLLVMNRVLCSDGVWRSLDGQRVYAHLPAASVYGAAVLRAELSRRLGWGWDRVGGEPPCGACGGSRPAG